MDSIQGIDPSIISSIVSSEYTRLFTAAAGAASAGVRRWCYGEREVDM